MEVDPPYTGEPLREFVHSPIAYRKPIVAGLLYEKTSLMVFADAGVGKSTISVQVAAELSCGKPVFGALEVPEPATSYYILFERDATEVAERLKRMEKKVPIDYSKLLIDDKMVGIDLFREEHRRFLVQRIEKYCASPSVIFLDPIYASISGGLSKDEKATAFTRFCAILQKKFNCALWLNHHTSRESFSSKGERISKEDSYYGSTWIKAHVTGSFHLKGWEGGSILEKKKDNYKTLFSSLKLTYDPATYLSFMDKSENEVSKRDMFVLALNWHLSQKKKFTMKEIVQQVGSTDRYIRELMDDPIIKSSIIEHSSPGKSTIFEVTKTL